MMRLKKCEQLLSFSVKGRTICFESLIKRYAGIFQKGGGARTRHTGVKLHWNSAVLTE